MSATVLVKNTWYVAGLSAEFPEATLKGQIVAEKPIVLAIDDAHLLDPPSAALVHLIARAENATVIGTLRNGEQMGEAAWDVLKPPYPIVAIVCTLNDRSSKNEPLRAPCTPPTQK